MAFLVSAFNAVIFGVSSGWAAAALRSVLKRSAISRSFAASCSGATFTSPAALSAARTWRSFRSRFCLRSAIVSLCAWTSSSLLLTRASRTSGGIPQTTDIVLAVTFPPIAEAQEVASARLPSSWADAMDAALSSVQIARNNTAGADFIDGSIYFGLRKQSDAVELPAVTVEPLTLPPIATLPQAASALAPDLAGGGKKYTTTTQSPVAATTSPPPIQPKISRLR